MRWTLRFLLLAILLFVLATVLLIKSVEVWDQYNVPAYIWASLNTKFRHEAPAVRPSDGPGDKVVVMAKTEAQNTDWVAEHLPEWATAIYTVDASPSSASTNLSVPANKGNEAMAYLTYLIDHYSSLPSILAFIHPHRAGFRAAWHTDTPLHDNVDSLQSLNLAFVRSNGYVNLRCNWNPGCKASHRKNKHVTKEVWGQVFGGASQAILAPTTEEEGQEGYVPALVGQACCAQFAVSRERVLKRPKEDYKEFRRWLLETEKNNAKSGRVLEFLWHVVFGMGPVYCPDEKKCYCDVYGRC